MNSNPNIQNLNPQTSLNIHLFEFVFLKFCPPLVGASFRITKFRMLIFVNAEFFRFKNSKIREKSSFLQNSERRDENLKICEF